MSLQDSNLRILITNDDGIDAAGLKCLARVASRFGVVKVVAPDRERSACAHAMTMRDPLRIEEVFWEGIRAYKTNGFPVDCVNLGLQVAWPDGCDLILSGINSGPNLGFDITYSGTVAGAMEGTINRISSIALSMAGFVSGAPLHFATAEKWLDAIWPTLTSIALPPLTFLNVNVPNIEFVELRGTKVAPMGQRIYEERVELRADPWGKPYYWQGGVQALWSDQPHSDVQAVSEGFVSVTPVTLDWTDHPFLDQLRNSLRSS